MPSDLFLSRYTCTSTLFSKKKGLELLKNWYKAPVILSFYALEPVYLYFYQNLHLIQTSDSFLLACNDKFGHVKEIWVFFYFLHIGDGVGQVDSKLNSKEVTVDKDIMLSIFFCFSWIWKMFGHQWSLHY